MVWAYVSELEINADRFKDYSLVFNKLWIASAFKGATESLSILPNVTKHFTNHLSWLKRVDQFSSVIEFRGIALTGWLVNFKNDKL
jgi:hexosaminidase